MTDKAIVTAQREYRQETTHLLTHEFRAMGSQITALLQTDAPLASLALERVPVWFERWEQQFSRFRAGSELSLLNNSSGQPVPVSPEFYEVLGMSLAAAEYTGGLVTPLLLGAIETAGYDRSFEILMASAQWASPARNDPNSSRSHRPTSDWRSVQLSANEQAVVLPAGTRLDFGGIAKGWAADRAVSRLMPVGPALVDAGGDIAVNGPMSDGSPWPVGVGDPLHPNEQIALLRISSGGVATSGRDYRRWRHNGIEQHHIIDPRTGEQAATDVLSATVVAPSAAFAEIAAKAALILGSSEGLQWLNNRQELAGLLVLDDGTLLQTQNFSDYTWAEE